MHRSPRESTQDQCCKEYTKRHTHWLSFHSPCGAKRNFVIRIAVSIVGLVLISVRKENYCEDQNSSNIVKNHNIEKRIRTRGEVVFPFKATAISWYARMARPRSRK
jgi:hypothetical protein